MDALPADLVIDIIAFTSPPDACRFSLTSSYYRSIVDSNLMWKLFLPSNIASIISRAVDPIEFSMKELFSKLSERHVMLDDGNMSFQLDKSSGATCYMISARKLDIAFSTADIFDDTPVCWNWISLADSRFLEAAEAISECRLHISGKITKKALSPNRRYDVQLIYKLTEPMGLFPVGQITLEASLIVDRHTCKKTVFLEPFYEKHVKNLYNGWKVPYEGEENNKTQEEGLTATERCDGWTEATLGSFLHDGSLGDVEVLLKEPHSQHWRGGLIIEGVEFRSK